MDWPELRTILKIRPYQHRVQCANFYNQLPDWWRPMSKSILYNPIYTFRKLHIWTSLSLCSIQLLYTVKALLWFDFPTCIPLYLSGLSSINHSSVHLPNWSKLQLIFDNHLCYSQHHPLYCHLQIHLSYLAQSQLNHWYSKLQTTIGPDRFLRHTTNHRPAVQKTTFHHHPPLPLMNPIWHPNCKLSLDALWSNMVT